MSSLDQSSSSQDSRADWSYDQWQSQWTDMLQHVGNLMKDGKVFLAIEYIASDLFMFVGDFTEDFQMGKQAKVQNLLTKIQNLRNDVETQFDAAKDSKDSGIAQQAFNDYYGSGPIQTGGPYKGYPENMGIKNWLDWGVAQGIIPQSFATSIEQEFVPSKAGGIFQGWPNTSGGAQELVNDWNGLWNSNNPDQPNSIQVVTNALTAVSTDVSSQSSIVQSKLKFDEANDEQYKSITHSIQSEFINQEKQMNQAMASAG